MGAEEQDWAIKNKIEILEKIQNKNNVDKTTNVPNRKPSNKIIRVENLKK